MSVSSNIQVAYPVYEYNNNNAEKARTCVDLYAEKAIALKLNNKSIFTSWKLVTPAGGTADFWVSSYPYNNPEQSSLHNAIYMRYNSDGFYLKLANDFANYNFGLWVTQSTNTGNSNNARVNTIIGIQPCYIDASPINTSDTSSFTSASGFVPLVANYNNYRFITKHPIAGDRSNYYNAFKVYYYSGTNISFISAFGLQRSAIFSYMKNIENPLDVKPFFIFLCPIYASGGSQSYCDICDATTGLQLNDNMYVDVYTNYNRIPYTYTADINKYSVVNDKLILYKFTHKGYYCDNVFTYEGELPYEHFVYDGHEYVHIVRNLVLKLS